MPTWKLSDVFNKNKVECHFIQSPGLELIRATAYEVPRLQECMDFPKLAFAPKIKPVADHYSLRDFRLQYLGRNDQKNGTERKAFGFNLCYFFLDVAINSILKSPSSATASSSSNSVNYQPSLTSASRDLKFSSKFRVLNPGRNHPGLPSLKNHPCRRSFFDFTVFL
ncbi:hypothetical protein Aperf_G00000010905 [Anoplocephala perfoliata]